MIHQNKTYFQFPIVKGEIVFAIITYCKNVDIHGNDNDKTIPTMYWLPKIHKTSIGSKFIVASKTCNIASKVFKMVYNHGENFHNKSPFYSNFKKIWFVKNSFPIANILNKINARKKPKQFQLLTSAYVIRQFLITFLLKLSQKLSHLFIIPKPALE